MKELSNPDRLTMLVVAWMPDGKHVAFLGSAGTGPLRGYIRRTEDGVKWPFTPSGVNVNTASFWRLPVSPDGSRAVLVGGDGGPYLFPTNGGQPEPLPGILPAEYVVSWTQDERALYVTAKSGSPHRVFRLDLATGRRVLWKELHASQAAGVRLSQISMTPDGRTFLHSYARLLSNPYVAEGLRWQ